MSEISHKDLVEWGQEHLAEAIEQMSPDEQDRFLEPFKEAPIPWLLSSIRGTAGDKGNEAPLRIVPPEAVDGGDRDSAQSRAAYEKGIELLKAGKIGILLVAGGMGTRLGWDGPKGTYPVGPLSERSLFQGFAEQIHRLQAIARLIF